MTAVTSKHDIPLLDEQGEPKTYLTAGFNGRDDLFCIYLTGRQMLPWRDAGQLVVGEKNRPPRNNDHVVIFMTINRQRVITVRQLLASDDPDTIVVKQHNPDNGPQSIERKAITALCRVITWDDVIPERTAPLTV
jgi:hypothetical protein